MHDLEIFEIFSVTENQKIAVLGFSRSRGAIYGKHTTFMWNKSGVVNF